MLWRILKDYFDDTYLLFFFCCSVNILEFFLQTLNLTLSIGHTFFEWKKGKSKGAIIQTALSFTESINLPIVYIGYVTFSNYNLLTF